jgi:ribosomal protein S24E
LYDISCVFSRIFSCCSFPCSFAYVSAKVIEVVHNGLPGISKKELKEKLAKMYKVDNPQLVVVFGIRTQFGGGRTSGFGLIYDNLTAAKKFESKYRQVRVRQSRLFFMMIISQNLFFLFFFRWDSMRRKNVSLANSARTERTVVRRRSERRRPRSCTESKPRLRPHRIKILFQRKRVPFFLIYCFDCWFLCKKKNSFCSSLSQISLLKSFNACEFIKISSKGQYFCVKR